MGQVSHSTATKNLCYVTGRRVVRPHTRTPICPMCLPYPNKASLQPPPVWCSTTQHKQEHDAKSKGMHKAGCGCETFPKGALGRVHVFCEALGNYQFHPPKVPPAPARRNARKILFGRLLRNSSNVLVSHATLYYRSQVQGGGL